MVGVASPLAEVYGVGSAPTCPPNGSATPSFSTFTHKCASEGISNPAGGIICLLPYTNHVTFCDADPICPPRTTFIPATNTCDPIIIIDQHPVGGEILSIDMTSLFVVGAMTNAFWILPTLGGIAGVTIALFKVKRKSV